MRLCTQGNSGPGGPGMRRERSVPQTWSFPVPTARSHLIPVHGQPRSVYENSPTSSGVEFSICAAKASTLAGRNLKHPRE